MLLRAFEPMLKGWDQKQKVSLKHYSRAFEKFQLNHLGGYMELMFQNIFLNLVKIALLLDRIMLSICA